VSYTVKAVKPCHKKNTVRQHLGLSDCSEPHTPHTLISAVYSNCDHLHLTKCAQCTE